jgi:hypothetical protein
MLPGPSFTGIGCFMPLPGVVIGGVNDIGFSLPMLGILGS